MVNVSNAGQTGRVPLGYFQALSFGRVSQQQSQITLGDVPSTSAQRML